MDLTLCDFQNQYMKEPCGIRLMNDHGEPFCYLHGTRRFVERAWDNNLDSENEQEENAGKSWTSEEEKLLKELRSQGYTVPAIAYLFKRSTSSIYNKLWINENG